VRKTLRTIAVVSAVLTLLLCLWAQGHPSGPEEDTVQMQGAVVDVHEGQGRTVRGFCATVSLDKSPAEFAAVFAFFDPTTGAFWWKSDWRSGDSKVYPGAVEGFLKYHQVRTANNKLVVFWTTDMPAKLIVQESMLRVDKLEDAWRVVKRDASHQPRYGLEDEDNPDLGIHVIALHKLLSDSFFTPKAYEESAMRPFHPPDIKNIKHGDSRWQVTLAGANGLTATILLDDQYQFIKTSSP